MATERNPLPNYIYCSITGKRFAVRRDVLLQRMKAAGGLERLKKSYVSREARSLIKTGKTIEEVRQLLGCDPEYANMNLTTHAATKSSSMAKSRIQQGEDFHAFWRDAGWRVPQAGEAIGRAMTQREIGEATTDACLYPNHKLDKECERCPVFNLCMLPTKGIYRR